MFFGRERISLSQKALSQLGATPCYRAIMASLFSSLHQQSHQGVAIVGIALLDRFQEKRDAFFIPLIR
ncbi:MAG: hypothetical protein ACD_17C00086G0003 [uncultured bacterium]|nr:MAG: hypothetical protein ACD_17C00086G0003 [uncultured bacterium]